jgi:hypothetical protein
MAYVWRGPFRVMRDGRAKWKIVNAQGTEERLGYRYKGAAEEECRLINLAQQYCDKDDEPRENSK